MATLALRPAYPVRPRSGSKPRQRKQRTRNTPRTPRRTIAITAGAIALAVFSVSAPMIGDPAGRLFALDATPTISISAMIGGDVWPARAFEFTPTLLGPAIELLTPAIEPDVDVISWTEGDSVVVMMPEFIVHAVPPLATDRLLPPG